MFHLFSRRALACCAIAQKSVHGATSCLLYLFIFFRADIRTCYALHSHVLFMPAALWKDSGSVFPPCTEAPPRGKVIYFTAVFCVLTWNTVRWIYSGHKAGSRSSRHAVGPWIEARLRILMLRRRRRADTFLFQISNPGDIYNRENTLALEQVQGLRLPGPEL